MILHLLAVGRVRHPALREACDEYLVRARRYFRLELVEVPDSVRERHAAGIEQLVERFWQSLHVSSGEEPDWDSRELDVQPDDGFAPGLDSPAVDPAPDPQDSPPAPEADHTIEGSVHRRNHDRTRRVEPGASGRN